MIKSASLPLSLAVALSVARLPMLGQAGLSAAADPANLAGERVKTRTVLEDLPQDTGAAGLAQSLKKLGTRASLMLIVAHPDDEDGGMLTYESRGQGARVATMTLNRGEGGQNLMSADFDDALGLVRTQELLAADRYMGVDQMFGSVVDFGFSKTKEEAFAQWGHDRVLYDVVRAVRLYRPLVIASVFIGGVTDGHGQHQVAGEMAQEVFNAAGDPKVFPEMGLAPWAPLKVYARVPFARVTAEGMYDYATGKYSPARFYNYVSKTWSTDTPKANVVVPEGETSELLGMSYVQFARKGLALQKTQIGGGVRVPPAGKFDVGYTRYGSRVATLNSAGEEKSFFEGVDVSLVGIAGLAPAAGAFLRDDLGRIQGLVEKAAAGFSMDAPEKIAPVLRDGLSEVDALIGRVEAGAIPAKAKGDVLHELRVKRVQFNDALLRALGVTMTATAEGAGAGLVPGSKVAVRVKVTKQSGAEVEFFASEVSLGVESAPRTGAPQPSSEGGDHLTTIALPSGLAATRPYFSRTGVEQPYYDLADPNLRDAPATPYPLTVSEKVGYGGVSLMLRSAVLAAQPVRVVPAVSVGVSPGAGIVPLAEKSLTVTARVRSDEAGAAKGTVRLELPAGWKASPERGSFALGKIGEAADVAFTVMPPALASGKEYTLAAVAEVDGKEYREGYKSVGYGDLARTNYFRPATYRASGVDVKVAPGLKVAYLPGTGDDVAGSLTDMGVRATPISVEDVSAGRLGAYDAVVLGVRAFAAHRDLEAANGKLLEYAAGGGVVIVQYNTGSMAEGPYPFSLGDSEKVVDERAAVTLLDPKAPVLSWPNRITAADFDGWVEERGHGFMGTWDARYEAPTEVHDPGQDPQKGGLLMARTGKGAYIYLAYALYRQLPEGVGGGFRLFANMLSLGKNPALK